MICGHPAYCIYPKKLDGQVRANSAYQDQMLQNMALD